MSVRGPVANGWAQREVCDQIGEATSNNKIIVKAGTPLTGRMAVARWFLYQGWSQ